MLNGLSNSTPNPLNPLSAFSGQMTPTRYNKKTTMKKIFIFAVAMVLFQFDGVAQKVIVWHSSTTGDADSVRILSESTVESNTYEDALKSALTQAYIKCLQSVTTAKEETEALSADVFEKIASMSLHVEFIVEKTPQGSFNAHCSIMGEGKISSMIITKH